jgi:hypothetical protein
VRSDPSENGGLFVGRRPGTRPVHYRGVPEEGSTARKRRDAVLAGLILGVMIFINLLFWGPIPVGWLWVVSQVPYFAEHIFIALSVAFIGILLTLMGALVLLKQLDGLWILVRRASGVDQRDGVIGRVFAYTAIVGVTFFSLWLVFGGGLADSLNPPAQP